MARPAPDPSPPSADDLAAGAAHFAEHGWLLTRTLDGTDAVRQLQRWTDEVAAWPDDGDGWLHHRELTDHGPRLCRSENLIPFHDGLRRLLTAGSLLDTASALLGEEAVLYKEKVNYKLAGGAGYAPHQDAPAYPFLDRHVSCMVAVDDATLANGCLEVVEGCHHEVLPVDDGGCIRADVVASLAWRPVEVPAGWTLWFHSRTPHRSGPNTSSTPRRALYPTYNARSEGDLRAAYYREKQARFAAGDGRADGLVQVSLIDDFQGRPVRVTASSVGEVVALFQRWGPDRYDEDVSQLEHALQVAAHAVTAGAGEPLVAAALLHDTGHLLDLAGRRPGEDLPAADLAHEATGARWLAGLFDPQVTGPIALHVAAKRYRCAVDPSYRSTLSAGSVASLARQGGPMSADERARFERHPAHRDAVVLRGWDDAGKVTDQVTVPGLATYRPLLDRLARPA